MIQSRYSLRSFVCALATAAVLIPTTDAGRATKPRGPDGAVELASHTQFVKPSKAELIRAAQRDPSVLSDTGERIYETQIDDYTATFIKQERIDGKLGKPEEIEVRFRDFPHSVYMIWKKNADQARRALYVDSPEFKDSKGRKLAKVEPNGAIARLFVSEVEIEIHGKRSREASRRSIDEFGFYSTLTLLRDINSMAKQRGVLDYRYDGEDEVDGRPTFRMVRYLPYQGEKGDFPDAKLVLHLDQEWLMPIGLYSYADHEGKTLLGSYVFHDLRVNVGLSEADFKF
ncbi:MAG: DUF1571 domain-containing protein [Phycisphaerales bacterium]|nr:DUF1571 domain-containing protein [Phycisphaerales bacterium]